jgi:tetratricopeptide (TPR) repeat protein
MASKLVIVILGLTATFFLPTTQNFYDTNKWMLLAAGALLTLVYWAFDLFRRKTHILIRRIPSGALGFGALTIASLIGLFAASTNKIEALLSPLGPVTFLALTILVLAASAAAKPWKVYLKRILYATTGILGLIALYQALGMGKLMFPGVPYLADPLWTPTGATATTIALFFITLSLLVPDMIAALAKRHEHGTLALLAISCIVIATGTVITLSQFIPKMTSGVMPFDVGMVVASKIFKNPTSAAVGVGAENFLTAFTMSRPPNLTAGFGTNADFFLHILTIYGLIGLTGALVLVGSLLAGNKKGWFFITRCLCIASFALVPPTIALLAIVAAVLVLAHDDQKHTPKPVAVAPWVRISAGFLLLLLAAASFFFLIRAYTAEVYFFRSLRAAEVNDGTKTYNLQIRAIETNTFLSRYHIAYSRTSLSLANNMAGSGTKNDQDLQLVGQLVQQAVREAKIAVTLNANSVTAWENLGLTYQTIIPVATEAAGWALSAYEKSATLDPANPVLFLNIGSVFVNQKEYDNSIAVFDRSIQLNPSYANAYYNLANAYKLKGDTVNAAAALTKTMNLVEKESSDYYKVKNELDAL